MSKRMVKLSKSITEVVHDVISQSMKKKNVSIRAEFTL